MALLLALTILNFAHLLLVLLKESTIPFYGTRLCIKCQMDSIVLFQLDSYRKDIKLYSRTTLRFQSPSLQEYSIF
jgi:hypothetical protein